MSIIIVFAGIFAVFCAVGTLAACIVHRRGGDTETRYLFEAEAL